MQYVFLIVLFYSLNSASIIKSNKKKYEYYTATMVERETKFTQSQLA